MSIVSRALRVACLLLVLGWGGAAQAQYLLTGGSSGGLQIGTGLPLPVQPIFLGGMVMASAGTPFWPPLIMPVNPNILSPNDVAVKKFT